MVFPCILAGGSPALLAIEQRHRHFMFVAPVQAAGCPETVASCQPITFKSRHISNSAHGFMLKMRFLTVDTFCNKVSSNKRKLHFDVN